MPAGPRLTERKGASPRIKDPGRGRSFPLNGSGDVVHRVGQLDLVSGVAAEQVAVLVAEVGGDRVAEAGDVLAGARLVLGRRAGRRGGAVQVGRRRGRLE